jgi:TPR repeat protein
MPGFRFAATQPTALHEEACAQGEEYDCFLAGEIHALGGFNVPIDNARALAYFVQSCDLGSAQGCLKAAHFAQKHAADEPAAQTYRQKACALGEQEGCAAGR